jgi:hypothetical protein
MEGSAKTNAILDDKQRRVAEAKLRKLLEEAEASGKSDKTVGEIWAAAESRYLEANRVVKSENPKSDT